MKPVLVLQFSHADTPGHFGTTLGKARVPWHLIHVDDSTLGALPPAMTGYSGLGLMGGLMGANDPLAWIPRVMALIKEAVHIYARWLAGLAG
jgi:GMP synthase-like glutamine amidotransferase